MTASECLARLQTGGRLHTPPGNEYDSANEEAIRAISQHAPEGGRRRLKKLLDNAEHEQTAVRTSCRHRTSQRLIMRDWLGRKPT
jgi:hypothetical protein